MQRLTQRMLILLESRPVQLTSGDTSTNRTWENVVKNVFEAVFLKKMSIFDQRNTEFLDFCSMI